MNQSCDSVDEEYQGEENDQEFEEDDEPDYASLGNDDDQEADKSEDLNDMNPEKTIYQHLHQTEAPKRIEQMENFTEMNEEEKSSSHHDSNPIDFGEAQIQNEVEE